MEIEETPNGCSATRIDLFTGSWEKAEFDQLKEFKDGCIHLVHKFSHYADEDDY